MSQDIFVLIEQQDGTVSESSFELLGKARQLAGTGGGNAVAIVLGDGVEGIAGQLGAADQVIAVNSPSLANFTPSGYVAALTPILQERGPLLTLCPNSAIGMDTAAGLSGALGWPLAAYAVNVVIDDGKPLITSQLYGGKVNIESSVEGAHCLVTASAGSFPADEGKQEGSPAVEVVAYQGDTGGISFSKLIVPEGGDVDITKADVLVSVGRGIGDGDDIEILDELAKALGGAVSASRPVVDAGWLPKSRQVGKSGQTVKPKLYLAVGISGAPEHLEGMRDADLIVAINQDAAAPIFSIADYGVVGDLFDVIPELTERVKARAEA